MAHYMGLMLDDDIANLPALKSVNFILPNRTELREIVDEQEEPEEDHADLVKLSAKFAGKDMVGSLQSAKSPVIPMGQILDFEWIRDDELYVLDEGTESEEDNYGYDSESDYFYEDDIEEELIVGLARHSAMSMCPGPLDLYGDDSEDESRNDW